MGLLRQRPDIRALHMSEWELLLLAAAAFAAFCFLLEYCGTTLMNTFGTTGQVIGFMLAYPVACFAPIAWGWWMTHRKRQTHIRSRQARRSGN